MATKKSSTKSESPLKVGNNVFIRTVTVYHVGHIEELTDTEIVLSSASWVASTGRFHQAVTKGTLDEIEPFLGVVSVNRSVVVDVTEWPHPLPKEQK